jgi:ethanolamine kinase
LLPTVSTRREFIREYLRGYRKESSGDVESSSGIEEAAVTQLMADVDQFRGLPGFYWQVINSFIIVIS